MNFYKKIQGILLISGLILSFVVSLVVFSSQRDMSEPAPQAMSPEDESTPTAVVTTTPTTLPTLLSKGAQDVPLKVLGQHEEVKKASYLYTELTSKGIISNVTANSASILWLTEAPQKTSLRYGLSPASLSQKISTNTPVYLHEAKLKNLRPNTLYYYTGHAPITETFTTPSTLKYTPPKQILNGTIAGSQGSCLVRAMISGGNSASSYLTVITNDAKWQFSLDTLRTADYSQYYEALNSDTVEIDVLCVSSGKVLYTGSKSGAFTSVSTDPLVIEVARAN